MKTIITIFILCCALSLSAQPLLPEKVSARFPAVLNSEEMPTFHQLQRELCYDSDWGQDRRSVQKLWIAYSDRADNITYTSPDRRTHFGSLRFGEKVCIAEINDNMAHVYSDEKARYPDIAGGIKSKGWVPMEDLLLWNRCPKDKNGGQRRVITAVNLDRMPRDGKVHTKKYISPDDLSKSAVMDTDIDLYFFMKETDNGEYALLSSGAKVNSAQSLYGWVNKNNFVDFSQRVFIEPEWMPEFVEAHRGEKTFIYGDEDMISVIMSLECGKYEGESNQTTRFRMPSQMLRFPVLSKPDAKGMVRCLCFGNATDFHEKFLKERTGLNYSEVMEVIRNKVCSYESYVKLGAGWRYILLLSDDELKEIVATTQPIAEVASAHSSDRQIFVDVLLATIKEQSTDGRRPKDGDILKMPIWKILYMIYGVDVVEENYCELYHYTLQDVKNKKIMSDSDYFDILHRFEENHRRLKSFISYYEYRMDIRGMYYYWIPLDDMP